jgi:ketosteroid isomerase-like protein
MPRAILLAIITLAIGASGSRGAAEDEIRSAEKRWAAAVTAGDLAALDRMLGEQLIYAHASGVVENKGEYLGRLRSGAQKYDAIEHQEITVRVYGDSAVAHAKARMAGQSNGRAFDDRLMLMHFWVKQGGSWRLVAHQTARLP